MRQTPYLHFETNEGRVRLRHAIKRIKSNQRKLADDSMSIATGESSDWSSWSLSGQSDDDADADASDDGDDDDDDSSDTRDQDGNYRDRVDDDKESEKGLPTVDSQHKGPEFKGELYLIYPKLLLTTLRKLQEVSILYQKVSEKPRRRKVTTRQAHKCISCPKDS